MVPIGTGCIRFLSAVSCRPAVWGPPLSTRSAAAWQEPFINGTNATYVEDMYNAWRKDPATVHSSWASFFKSATAGAVPGQAHARVPTLAPAPAPASAPAPGPAPAPAAGTPAPRASKVSQDSANVTMAALQMIRGYQTRGHLLAKLDPLQISLTSRTMGLDQDNTISYDERVRRHHESFIGFYFPSIEETMDLRQPIPLPSLTFVGNGETSLPLGEVISRMQRTYCGHVGIEYMHMTTIDEVAWLREKMETADSNFNLTVEEKTRLLKRLIRANHLEVFLAKKWPGEKRFGLEGCEALVPVLKEVIDKAMAEGAEMFIIGMAHRGRLNVLANVCRKPLESIFAEFAGLELADPGSGDVKYHLGTQVKRLNRVSGKQSTLVLVANPSHLEAVAPVVEGRTRAEQFYLGDTTGTKVVPIIVHGDASFSGQGVCFESINMTNLPCYTNHGTIHIVANNQVGFTTDPRYSRSSPYCSDLGRVVNAPIFHVNADDPEAAMFVANAAVGFRYKFRRCVVVDLVGYRRNGHNETDEPMFTQPLMYTKIRALKPVNELYAEKLVKEKVVEEEFVKSYAKQYLDICEKGFEDAKEAKESRLVDWLDAIWTGFFTDKDPLHCPPTGVPIDTLMRIGHAVSVQPPEDFIVHRGIARILKARMELVESKVADWAIGECLAFGSLLLEGTHVRLSGQDVERGTFSHRHHVLHHQTVDLTTLTPLKTLDPKQAQYTVCNSSLSEYGVLGFETGYSMAWPHALVMWEAQFGDFSNTAQCIIDQFLSSGQSKWVRQCGLVLLLPHGMEGQGPEHSSARLERFLQMCADDSEAVTPDMLRNVTPQEIVRQLSDTNWIVAIPTTPASHFHLLRRQIALPFRKPLIALTPKSLLRLPDARSQFSEMSEGTEFQRLIPASGPCTSNADNVKRLIFCCGKVYYDVRKFVEDSGRSADIAIARLEQLCPFPYDLVLKERELYKNANVAWVQEEHKNQGGWGYVAPRIRAALAEEAVYIGRSPAASPATGNKVLYKRELEGFLNQTIAV